MGNIASGTCKLTSDEMVRLSSTSVFNPTEIRALWFHFDHISQQQDKLTKAQFQAAMLFQDSILMDRLFKVFDEDKDDLVSFPEYVACLSIVSNKAKPEDKLNFSFKIYDCDNDGYIGTNDLMAVVAATLHEQDVVIKREDLDQVVEQTMKEAHPEKAGFISYDEYLGLVANRPYMLSHMTLNISNTIQEYSSLKPAKP